MALTSVIAPNLVNEVRAAWSRLATTTASDDPCSETIPSIEIADLALSGFNAANNRTGDRPGGELAAVPQQQHLPGTGQPGVDTRDRTPSSLASTCGARRSRASSSRRSAGGCAYTTLQASLTILPARRGRSIVRCRAARRFSTTTGTTPTTTPRTSGRSGRTSRFTYGLRYELPGNNFDDLVPVNDAIVAANGNDERFRFTPVP